MNAEGLERGLSGLKCLFLLWKSHVWLLAPISGRPHPPVTLVLEDPAFLAFEGTCMCMVHLNSHRHAHTYINKQAHL